MGRAGGPDPWHQACHRPAQVSLSPCSVTFCQGLWWPRGEPVPLQAS